MLLVCWVSEVAGRQAAEVVRGREQHLYQSGNWLYGLEVIRLPRLQPKLSVRMRTSWLAVDVPSDVEREDDRDEVNGGENETNQKFLAIVLAHGVCFWVSPSGSCFLRSVLMACIKSDLQKKTARQNQGLKLTITKKMKTKKAISVSAAAKYFIRLT